MFKKIIEKKKSYQLFLKIFLKKAADEHKISSNSSFLNIIFSYLSFKSTKLNTFFFSYSPINAEKCYNYLNCLFNDSDVFFVEDDQNGNILLSSLFKLYNLDRPMFIIMPFEYNFTMIPAKNQIKEFIIKKENKLNLEIFFSYLENNNYIRKDNVWDIGEFSIRGDVIDFFPYGEDYPIRIELFDDEVESIYFFDQSQQMQIKDISDYVVFPENSDIQKTKNFMSIYKKTDNMIINNIENTTERLRFLMNENLLEKRNEPIAKFELFAKKRNFLKIYSLIDMQNYEMIINTCRLINFSNNVELFSQNMETWINKGYTILFFIENPNRIKVLQDIVLKVTENIRKKAHIFFIEGNIDEGFIYETDGLVFVSERDLIGNKKRLHRKENRFRKEIDDELKNITIGDFIVHEDYGIGRFLGIENKKIAQFHGDFFTVQYKNNERLYLPIDRLYKVHKYISAGVYKPVLDSLRSQKWITKKSRAAKSLEKMLLSIINLYAEREISKGYAFSKNNELHKSFENDFLYEETIDQEKVIKEIEGDMELEKPMDRLLVGDVGFGKTEVAMRSAFKAVFDGKQVAVLAPTTILCEQHFITFKSRFERYGLSISMLSRIVSPKNRWKIIKGIKYGDINIVIGTHRILSDDVEFNDLGLLIVDEEQRFGVKAKEKIRLIKRDVDTLTMSATPIPRTLYMSLSKIRPMSIIETPPHGRMGIKTIVSIFNKDVLKSAILEEIKRGGQIFFVHNNIKDLEKIRDMILKLVPELRVVTLHGQMPAKEIEGKMKLFQRSYYDLLISTTIIEIGIDLPNVNTIIINNGENFGLSQLYQLKGRVGRSYRQAYAYIFVSSFEKMNPNSVKRLSAIKEYQDLGSGYRLAVKDLEIRGIGNLFGTQQSGNISNIGLGMYLKILESVIEKIKDNGVMLKDTFIDIGIFPYIPQKIVPLEIERQRFYLDIINSNSFDKLQAIKERFIRKYGDIPYQVIELFDYQWIKLAAMKANVESIVYKNNTLLLKCSKNIDDIFTVVKNIYSIDIKKGENNIEVSIATNNILNSLKKILKNFT